MRWTAFGGSGVFGAEEEGAWQPQEDPGVPLQKQLDGIVEQLAGIGEHVAKQVCPLPEAVELLNELKHLSN